MPPEAERQGGNHMDKASLWFQVLTVGLFAGMLGVLTYDAVSTHQERAQGVCTVYGH